MALVGLVVKNLQGGDLVFVFVYPLGEALGKGFVVIRPACVGDFIDFVVNFLLVLFADFIQGGDEFHGKRSGGGFHALFLYLQNGWFRRRFVKGNAFLPAGCLMDFIGIDGVEQVFDQL